MGDRRAKDALFEALASVAKGLASGRRAEIVDLLAQGERPVEQIASEIGQSVANTSHHLRILAAVGIVRARRDGTRVLYALSGADVAELWAAVRQVAARHVAAVEGLSAAYLGSRDGLEPLSREQLIGRLASGEVVVLDVRPRVEYEAGHIAGARSVPIDELESLLTELPADIPVVAYCRGPYCVFADDAVRLLRGRGFDAVRLEDGFPEWQRAGYPTASGPDALSPAEV